MARITAIILNDGRASDADACIEALRTQAGHSLDFVCVHPPQRPHGALREVTLVESSPEDALRRGADAAGGDVLLFLYPQTRFVDNGLDGLVGFLMGRSDVAAVQPRCWADSDRLLLHDPLSPCGRIVATHDSRSGKKRARAERSRIAETLYYLDAITPVETEAPAGQVLALPRGMLERVGPFDSALDEVAIYRWCRMARARGLRLLHLPTAEVILPRALASGKEWNERRARLEAELEDVDSRGLLRRLLSARGPGSVTESSEGYDSAPEVTVESSLSIPRPAGAERLFIQIAADPSFCHSLGAFSNGGGIELSGPALRALGSGRYFLRVVDPETLEILDRLRMSVQESAAEPTETQDGVSVGDIEIGPYRPGDEHSILRLWKKVFRKERPMEKWNWLFPENPAGMHIMVARASFDARIVAQFAGVLTRVRVRDEIHTFAQMVDSMSDPDCRTSLAKSGTFTQVVLTYVETWGRPGEESFGFGLPNRIAYRIGKKTQGYTDVCHLEWRFKDLGEPEPGPPAPNIRVLNRDTIDPRVDTLWSRVEAQYPIQTVRDSRYLTWRYARNPEATYRFFTAERAGELVGFAVGVERFIDQPHFAVVDWMLADGEEEAGRRMIEACENTARDAGCTRILGSFIPLGCTPDRLFEERGYALEKSMWKWVGRIYDPDKLDWDLMRTGFYLTLGDSDLV